MPHLRHQFFMKFLGPKALATDDQRRSSVLPRAPSASPYRAAGFWRHTQSRPMTRVFPALAPAAVADKWPIQSLAVEGNQIFPTAQILAVAGLKIGQVAGAPEFDAARDRLTESGAFETVGYKFVPAEAGKGYAATFQVAETTSIFPAQFEDLGAPDGEIEKLLASHDPLFSKA